MKFKLITIGLSLIFCFGSISYGQQNNAVATAHALFKAGQYAQAKAIYQKNLSTPGVRAYLFRCDQALKKVNSLNRTKTALETTIIPSVEFEETPLRDALTYLDRLVTEASNGKANSNILFLGTKDQGQKPVSFKLQQAPASEILKYICKQGLCQPRYDQFAVVVTPLSNVTATAETGQTASPSSSGSGSKSAF